MFRYRDAQGTYARDEVTLRDEKRDGESLLVPVVAHGEPLDVPTIDLDAAAAHARDAVQRLPEALRTLEGPAADYPVDISAAVRAERERALADLRGA